MKAPVLRPVALVLFLLLQGGPPAAAQDAGEGRSRIREGNSLYEKGQYPDAEVSYRKALEAERDGVPAKFNLGDALYRQDRYDEAAGQYEGALASAKDPSVRAQAFHNLGNARLKAKKLEESIESYKQALRLNPKDEDTRYNLEYARRLLQQQQQQQQQKKDKKDDKQNQQQKKDQEKKDEEKKDDQERDQDRKDQQKKNEQPRQPKDQISKADAERILEALRQQEQDVKRKLQKKTPVRVKVEKDW